MNFETVTIPCPFKRLVEGKTVGDLCAVSERWFMSDLTVDTKMKELLQETKEDLCDLMYKMLPMEDNNTRVSSSKTPFSAWQVCLSATQHEDRYQLDKLTPFQSLALDVQGTNKAAAFRKCPQVFTSPRCSLKKNEDLVEENNCIERDSNVKNTRAKSDSLDWTKNTDGGVCGRLHRNNRSASSSAHTEFQFRHSCHTRFYMKSYREQITDESIEKYIQTQLKEMNIPALNKQLKKINEASCITIPKLSSTYYRFSTKEKGAYENNILKVEPFSTRPQQSTSEKVTPNCNTSTLHRGKLQAKSNANIELTAEKKFIEGKSTLEFKQIASVREEDVASEPINVENVKDANKRECTRGKLKKVQLQVRSSTNSPRLVPKGRAISQRSRTRIKSVWNKHLQQWNRDSTDMSYESKDTRTPTFGEKEFLRIITPKPLIQSQAVRHMLLDCCESPSFSPDKSMEVSPTRSLTSSASGSSIPSQVFADILMKREPQVVFPKNSNFQACITPSNYSTSSAASHIRHRSTGTPKDTEKDTIKENNYDTQRSSSISSKSSFPKIGPFISG